MANILHSEHDEDLIIYPAPLEERNNGLKMWIINNYTIWATDYERALEIASLIPND